MRRAFRLRRLSAAGLLATALAVSSIATAPAASADPDIPFEATSTATITLAKLNMTTTGTSTISGTFDLGTGEITGALDLGSTETSVDIGGLTAATISVTIEPTAPFSAHLDLATLQIDASMSFNIHLEYIRPFGNERLNLVGNNCRTRSPIDIEVSGTVDLANFGLDASGEFEIPRFKSCGLLTPILSALISGPGNTFSTGPAA